MRRFFLIFVIALLPLRAWAGDVMALSIWPAQESHAGTVTADAPHLCHGSMLDALPAHAEPPAPAPHGTSHDMGSHGAHTACDVCHGGVLAATAPLTSPGPVPLSRPALGIERFASAEARSADKPPIA